MHMFFRTAEGASTFQTENTLYLKRRDPFNRPSLQRFAQSDDTCHHSHASPSVSHRRNGGTACIIAIVSV